MTILWSVWEIFVNFLECFFFHYLLVNQLGYKKGRKSTAVLCLSCLILCETALNFSEMSFVITTLSMLVLLILYSLICFEGSFTLRILWGLSGTIVTQTTNLIISNLLPLFSGLDIVDTLSPSPARFGVQIFYILIVISLYWILSRIPKQKNLTSPIHLQIITILIMGIGVFTVGQIVGFAIQVERTSADRNVLVSVSFAILIMLITIVLLFDKISQAIYEKAAMESHMRITALEEESIKKSKEMISIWNHDMKNHFGILQYYAQKNDYENLRKYLGDITSDLETISAIQSTGCSSIDACISSKIIVAHSKQIATTINISKICKIDIPESEMCAIIGNLLTNAIEACEKIRNHHDRYIELSIFQIHNMLHIDILNSSNGYYNTKNHKLVSNKREPNHGWGLMSMERTLKKYNSFYEIDPGPTYFQIRLFIPTHLTGGTEK